MILPKFTRYADAVFVGATDEETPVDPMGIKKETYSKSYINK